MLFRSTYARLLVALLPLFVFFLSHAFPQSTSGTITGTVTDPSGAVVPNATVEVLNPVSGYQRTTTTGANGQFQRTSGQVERQLRDLRRRPEQRP